jgi:predicted RNA-binding protein YlxR (DUF448 family)
VLARNSVSTSAGTVMMTEFQKYSGRSAWVQAAVKLPRPKWPPKET